MSYPNSVDEINEGMLEEGYDMLEGFEKDFEDMKIGMRYEQKKADNLAKSGYGYWLDNCGDDVWYCQHCLQPECGKRMARRI